MTKTIIAFDFGTQSIGVAVGQTLTKTASELTPIKARDGIPNWETMEKLINEWQPNLLVVGLPLNMDGTESELAKRSKKFGNRLRERYKINVVQMDERLSTYSAKEEAMDRRQTLDFSKNPVDSIAARLILESWFTENQSLKK
ncbi:MAG: Holliday junction resolvase RuvX [Cellvibrionaceae bacterium]